MMALESLNIIDDILEEGEASGFRLVVAGEIDFELAQGNISTNVFDRDGLLVSNSVIEFHIENPLIMSITITAIATAFAGCVAVTMAGISGSELYKHFQDSKKANPAYNLNDRCQDMIKRFRASGGTLKGAATGAISGCLMQAGLS